MTSRTTQWIRLPALAAAAAAVLAGPDARAQTFPDHEDWLPFECGGQLMWDPRRDQSGAIDERDIVGDDGAPAGYRAVDDDYLYLRMRLDQNAVNDDGSGRSFAWVIGFDLDRDATTFQLLVSADGVGNRVALFTKSETATPNDPTEPADSPPVAEFPFDTHARGVEAPDSSYGDNADYFLELAMPWEELEPLGLAPDTATRVWIATSANANRMNGDFACHDGDGVPNLDEVISDPVRPDGGDVDDEDWDDGDNGSGNGNGNGNGGGGDAGVGGTAFEGGGGCAAASPTSPAPWHLLLPLSMIAAMAWRTRRRVQPAGSRRGR